MTLARVWRKCRVDGSHKIEGHAHSGQMRAGQGVGRAYPGVADGVGRRQLFLSQMVVGDHNRHAQLASALHGFGIGNAAIHGEQYAVALFRQSFHLGDIEAIAFAAAIRNMPTRFQAMAFQHIQHQGRGGDAVNVIVAPDHQFFARQQFVRKQLGRIGNLGPLVWRSQRAGPRIEKGIDGLLLGKTPTPKDFQQQGRNGKVFGPRRRRGMGNALRKRTEKPVFHRTSKAAGRFQDAVFAPLAAACKAERTPSILSAGTSLFCMSHARNLSEVSCRGEISSALSR